MKQRKARIEYLWYSDSVELSDKTSLDYLLTLGSRLIAGSFLCNEKREGWDVILKMCARCQTPVMYPAAYCSTCQVAVDEQRAERLEETKKRSNKRYNAKRDPRLTQFYNSPEWRSLSAKVMQDFGYRCKDCGAIATQVHHEMEITTPEGWDRRFDSTILAPVCNRCHNVRHNRFGG